MKLQTKLVVVSMFGDLTGRSSHPQTLVLGGGGGHESERVLQTNQRWMHGEAERSAI